MRVRMARGWVTKSSFCWCHQCWNTTLMKLSRVALSSTLPPSVLSSHFVIPELQLNSWTCPRQILLERTYCFTTEVLGPSVTPVQDWHANARRCRFPKVSSACQSYGSRFWEHPCDSLPTQPIFLNVWTGQLPYLTSHFPVHKYKSVTATWSCCCCGWDGTWGPVGWLSAVAHSDSWYHSLTMIPCPPGGISSLPRPSLWGSGWTLPLCPGVPPPSASWGGGGRGLCWASEPNTDWRSYHHRLGRLAPPPATVLSGPSSSVLWEHQRPSQTTWLP